MIFQREKADETESTNYEYHSNEEEKNPGEWLNLSLSGNSLSTTVVGDYVSVSISTEPKAEKQTRPNKSRQ